MSDSKFIFMVIAQELNNVELSHVRGVLNSCSLFPLVASANHGLAAYANLSLLTKHTAKGVELYGVGIR